MFAHLLDRHLERAFGPGRSLPRWLRGLLDETFLWVAAGQLLLALGVRADSVRRLSAVHDSLEEARTALGAAGHPLPRLEDVRTYEELHRLEERFGAFVRGLEQLEPEELALIVPAPQAIGWIEGAAGVLLDLALEVLDRLRARRIRTELVGLDQRALREGVLRLRRMLDRAGLAEAAEDGYEAVGRRLEQLDADGVLVLDGLELETRPVAPGLGEVGRIVDVVRSLPRPTLDRLLPLRLLSSRPVMVLALTRALEQLRAGWVPPAERPGPAAVDPAQQRAAAWAAELVGHRRAVDERDARPEVRRTRVVHAGLLWTASAAVAGWMLWVVVGVVAPEWITGLARAVQLPPAALWLLPAGGVSLVAAASIAAAEVIRHLDRAELTPLSAPGASGPSDPVRRRRSGAAAAARGAGGGLVLLPLLLAVVIGVDRSFGGVLGAMVVAELGDPFWIALFLPMPVVLVAQLGGALRGEALAASRRPRLPPEQSAGTSPPPAV